MTAHQYASRPFLNCNPNQKAIGMAALKLVAQNRGNYHYVTQWQSGVTIWRNPQTDERIRVEPEGQP